MKFKFLFLLALSVAAGQVWSATLIGECFPVAPAPGLPSQINIYLDQATEEAPPYYLKGPGYAEVTWSNGGRQNVDVSIVELQGFRVNGAGFSLQMLHQDWRNPSPHILTFLGHKATFSCTSL